MRGLACAVVAAVVLASGAAHAKKPKKKRGGASAGLTVMVLPFTGKGAGGADVKEAIELELELVEVVTVSRSDAVESELKKGKSLAQVLVAHGVDVLVTGERGSGERSPDALIVTAIAKDGRPRFYKELPLGSEPDVAAATIVGALKPSLEGWKALRPIPAPGGDSAGVSADDVLVDDDQPTKPPPEKPPERHASIDDETPPPPPPPKKPEKPEHEASPLDFNDPADADKPKKKHRASIDDDDHGGGASTIARADVGDDGRRHSIDDVSDEVKRPAPSDKLAHAFLLSGAFDGATWYYNYAGKGAGSTSVSALFYPGGSAQLDAWPLAFAGVRWLGLDGDVALAAVPFKINGGSEDVNPKNFVSLQTRVGGAFKLRYTLQNGIGLGVRVGYRFYGANVEAQTITFQNQKQNLTLVPGYTLHAAAFGADVFVPLLIADHRLEIELRGEALPLTYYEEAPDNPGKTTLAFGWNASLAGRYDIAAGFFAEARLQSTGCTVTYNDAGSRVAFVGDKLQNLQGGDVLNLVAGFSVGVGFMF